MISKKENKNLNYDVIIVGGGHAGIEAANVCSKMQAKTLLISLSINKIGLTPCNPSIGGSAKGIVVREIDAMGGIVAKLSDSCTLQLKHLNKSKGYAVRSLRSQIDKIYYPLNALKFLKKLKNLTIIEDKIEGIAISDKTCIGVFGKNNEIIKAKKVILTTGTYMRSRILMGNTKKEEGPDGQETSSGITKSLKKCGINFIRLKTGTPPRILNKSIDYEKCTIVWGDRDPNLCFSFWNKKIKNTMVPCWLTHTNKITHEIIKNNMHQSPMTINKKIGIGPRYCPSIEDKIKRFCDKERHQLFLEPESLEYDSIYLQGFSTSLPPHLQTKIIRTIKGLENSRILKFGYAIEYDCIIPTQLKENLEFKNIKNLFSAGQINGTSGYEEAAAQGFMAGINSVCSIKKKKPFILNRYESYIGVMINDLIYKPYEEPYRLLSSLSENRLLLRSDNADQRLSKYGIKYNLLSKKEINIFNKKMYEINSICKYFNETYISSLQIKEKIKDFYIKENKIKFSKLVKNPKIKINDVIKLAPEIASKFSYASIEASFINIKYEGYLKLQEKEINKIKKSKEKIIPKNIDYYNITSLSNASKEKFTLYKPKTIWDASQIQGIKYSDLLTLTVYLKSKYQK